MVDCIFCKIVQGTSPSHIIWEDGEHLAFLSIFPNTPGFSVVIPKVHYPSYAFSVPEEVLLKLVSASRQVARIIDIAFDDVGRTGLIFEGFGVDHLHAKLFPMHGTAPVTSWKPIHSNVDKFFQRYEGYISSHDHKRAPDEELAILAQSIRRHVNSST